MKEIGIGIGVLLGLFLAMGVMLFIMFNDIKIQSSYYPIIQLSIIIGTTVICYLLGAYFEKEKLKDELREKNEREEAAKKKREQERLQKIQEELKYQKVFVVHAHLSDSGKPLAIVKRPIYSNEIFCDISNQRWNYCNIERSVGGDLFILDSTLKLLKEDCENWKWYDEEEFLKGELQREKERNQYNEIIQQMEILDKIKIEYLYHMTHKDNLENILKNGLKSYNHVQNNNFSKVNIADDQVQDRRARSEHIYSRSIHDYVPLYFNPKNPMLFRRNNIQNDIVILAIDRNILFKENVIFTDGNAANDITRFFKNTNSLNQLNWDCIWGDYWSGLEDGKRQRMAEALVFPDIPSNRIRKIFCNNASTLQFVESKIKKMPNIKAEVKTNMYFSTQIARTVNTIRINAEDIFGNPKNDKLENEGHYDDLPF